MNTLTKEKVRATFMAVCAIAEVIRSSGSVPSGHLYAVVMDKLSLEDYTKIIDFLKQTGLVKEENYMLIWTGIVTEEKK